MHPLWLKLFRSCWCHLESCIISCGWWCNQRCNQICQWCHCWSSPVFPGAVISGMRLKCQCSWWWKLGCSHPGRCREVVGQRWSWSCLCSTPSEAVCDWGWEWGCKNCLNSLEGCLRLCLYLFSLSWGRKALPRCQLQKGPIGSRMYQIPACWGELAGDASHLPSQLSPTGLICRVSPLPEFFRAAVDTRAVVVCFLPLCPLQCFAAVKRQDFAFCHASILCLDSDSMGNSWNIFCVIFHDTIISRRSHYGEKIHL